MPRTRRSIVPGGCYHVISRGNNRMRVFNDPQNFSDFFDLLVIASRRTTVDLLAACLMPNHFHLVVRTPGRANLGRCMHWLLTTHTHRHHRRHGTIGRVWQGRYKAFPIEVDEHLLAVMRYVERNALRANLVDRAEHWEWSSLAWRFGGTTSEVLTECPVPLPPNWAEYVNQPQTDSELEAIRQSVNRQLPFGSSQWTDVTDQGIVVDRKHERRGRPRKFQPSRDWIEEGDCSAREK